MCIRDRVDKMLQNAKADSNESRKEQQQRQALESLAQLFPGVHGRLFDLCNIVDRKYNVAATITLGKYMDAVVVDNDTTAISCIDYLKAQRLGRMTFLPLDIAAKPVNEQIRGQCARDGNRSLVVDVVTYDKKYDNVLRFACGDTIVVPDLQDGRDLCFGSNASYRVVTLDGALIAKNGNMSGGNSSESAKAQRWEQKDTEELKRRRDKWRTELNEIRQTSGVQEKEAELRSRLTTLMSKMDMLKRDQRKDLDKIKQHQANIKSCTKEWKKQTTELDKSREELQQHVEEVQELERKVGNIEEKIFGAFSANVGVRNIREYEENILLELSQHNEKKLMFEKNICRLENQHKLEHARDKSKDIKKIEAQIHEYAQTLAELRAKHDKYLQQTEDLESQLEKQNALSEEQHEQVKAIDTDLKELRATHNKLQSEMSGFQQKADSMETVLDQLRAKRFSLFQQTRVEEVMLPLHRQEEGGSERRGAAQEAPAKRRRASGGNKVSAAGMETTEAFMEADGSTDVGDSSKDSTAIRIDLSSVPEERRQPVNRDEAEREADEHREKLKMFILEMEKISPNTRALEKFAEAEDRLKDVVDEFELSKEASQEAMQKFDAVKAQRHELFMAAFKHVAGCIDETYKELTSSAKCPSGGTAVITVENEEEPYLHGIRYYPQPPFKGFRDIDQLSGGEKSISALALLFAIHSFKPAPFFVLDEVDAALDTANVAQVAKFIQAKKENTQFVVISLKDHFYENADGLVGICKNRALQSSAVFTLDLSVYPEVNSA
eukprot:TRINITY_DN29875_c0_g1_i1.p1 TRINITY_DN29875_c0_g1~~TRINITY_DN29875_c0_g1_i1.p1  ORF type:complete len:779 (-),score=249.77 TRINITY_DN29875_c0_g1_i1:438-2774(-)